MVWEELNKKIQATPPNTKKQKTGKIILLSWIKMAAAAVLIAAIGLSVFVRFYTTTINTLNAQHLSHILPDGSGVTLNASSTLSYQPYYWSFKRQLNFEGEGFFDVKKGSDFTVISSAGNTQVLGTSFNINTRNNQYEVFCLTGKVRVADYAAKNTAVLTPNHLAILNKTTIEVKKEVKATQILAWKNNKFNFIAQPLHYVLAEIERQYNIVIDLQVKEPQNMVYTGNFKKNNAPEAALDLICQSFGFIFVQTGDKTYSIAKK
jgi:transmembrane sensor